MKSRSFHLLHEGGDHGDGGVGARVDEDHGVHGDGEDDVHGGDEADVRGDVDQDEHDARTCSSYFPSCLTFRF